MVAKLKYVDPGSGGIGGEEDKFKDQLRLINKDSLLEFRRR